MKPKKVMLFDTAIATSNIGDEIIFSSVKEGLKPVIGNASIYRMGTHIENYSHFQMFLHKCVLRDTKVHAICENADLKFICGTNLLLENLLHPRPQFMLNYANKSLYDDSVLVGVGRVWDFKKFRNVYTSELYKRVLSKKYFHSVRDDATKAVLESYGIRCINTGCPTLWMMDKEKCSKIPQKKAENVVFSISGYKQQQEKDKDKILIECLLKNYSHIYAWIQTAMDEDYLRSLLNPEVVGIEMIYSLDMFGEILDRGNIDYVGTRLHGGIFSLQHNVRSLVISIDERAEEFNKSTNLPILKRDNLSVLDDILNNDIKTDIIVRSKEIKEFLNQFD